MRFFLQLNLDYIFFFYGLSFFILALICFSFKKEKIVKLPYIWLGLFGITHGVNEWLDLLAVTFSDNYLFSIWRTAVMALSFIFLIEFARRSMFSLLGKKYGLRAYIPFLVLAFSGALYGLEPLTITIRYFLALPGGLLSSWVLYKGLKADAGDKKYYPVVISASMALYAITAGLIVPKINFMPACWINQDSFSKIFIFPIQLLRGLFALCLTGSIWMYYRSSSVKSRNNSLIIIISLILVIGCGWIFVNYLDDYAENQLRRESRDKIDILSERLDQEILKVDQFVSALSGSPWIWPALASNSSEDIEKANDVLDRYDKNLNKAILYVMDTNGLTIASSNRNDADSFLGKSYNFRPYFQGAMSGKFGRYFGAGITSGERGYYVAAPVKDPQGEISGAVVIKKNAEILEDYFKHYSYAFLVDPNGIIFLSSNPELVFRNLWPIDAEMQGELILSRQFGDIPLNQPLFSKEIFNGTYITYDKHDFYVLRKDINVPGWSAISFNSINLVLYHRFFGIAIVIFIFIIIAIFYVVLERERELGELTADAEKEWSLTFDSMADGVSIHSPDFEIINVNKTLCELLGKKKEELIGQKCHNIFHSKNSPISECPLEKSKTSKQKEYVEVFESTLGKWLAVSVSPVLDGKGNIIKIIHLIRDITERKKLEGMKDEFVSTVSHELRTPLTAIREGIGIVLDGLAGSISNEQKDFLDTAKKNVDRLARLINNVLDYQKLQIGRVDFDIKEGDINTIVEDAKETMLPLARNKGLELNVNLMQGLPSTAFDKDKITQVLINLVNNAIKFTDKGSITIVTSKKYDNAICVSVIDTGPGIRAEDIDKLFQSFSQVGDGKEKRAGGTGLGLAISKAIVQKHGGKMWVESEYGKGSVFNFILPVVERRITK